jgi:hypothetical protein
VVVVLDSHVLLAPGSLAATAVYFDQRPGCRDLVQGPMVGDDGERVHGSHWRPEWGEGMYGKWDTDARALDSTAEPFDIPMQGLGLFAMRRDAWPGLHPRFRGFGGEEGYLHEKVRRGGGRTVCLPALRWAHRFGRPGGVPYSVTWNDRIRNYLIGWTELGWNTDEVRAHFRGILGPAADDLLIDIDAELTHPASRFDAVLAIASHPRRSRELADVLSRSRIVARQISAVEAADAEQSRALSHRHCIDLARQHGWRSVLVLDDFGPVPPDLVDPSTGDLAGAAYHQDRYDELAPSS